MALSRIFKANPSDPRDPIGEALALAQAGQPVPMDLQKQVFQFAAARKMAASDLEKVFGVPAGTAAATVQALGIADQVPMGLGGSMAPPPQAAPSGIGQLRQANAAERAAMSALPPPSQRMGLPPTTEAGVQYDPSKIVPNTGQFGYLSNPVVLPTGIATQQPAGTPTAQDYAQLRQAPQTQTGAGRGIRTLPQTGQTGAAPPPPPPTPTWPTPPTPTPPAPQTQVATPIPPPVQGRSQLAPQRRVPQGYDLGAASRPVTIDDLTIDNTYGDSEGSGTGAQSGTVTIGADGQQVFTDGQIDTIIPGPGTTTTTGGTNTITGGAGNDTLTGGAGTDTVPAGATIDSLITKFKTTPELVTQADTDTLISLAKQQNIDTFTLANMAGVSQELITNNLATMINPATNQPYGADYLRATPTTTFGADTGYTNSVVSTPEGAVTTVSREAPEIEARKLGLIDISKQLASREPTGGMPRHQVAGLSGLEEEAYGLADQWKGKALNAVGEGWDTLGEVKEGLYDTYGTRIPISDFGTEKYLSEYDPFITKGIGTLGQAERRARGAGDVGLGVAAGAMKRLRGTTDQFDPATGTSAYMNPYEKAVIDEAMSDITRAGSQQQQALNARAVQQGAFGGSRAALAQSELDRNILEQQGKVAANMRMQGYTQAQANALKAFEESKRRGQQAAQLTSMIGGQGAQGSLNAATQLANMANLTGRMGESRARTGLAGVDQYGRTTDQILKMGDIGRTIGINQGEMARLGQDVLIKDIATLEQAGASRRAANQRALDAERANRMQDIKEPFQRASWMSDILQGAPSTQMEMVKKYEQQPSGAAQAIGGIGSLAATAAGAKRAGII